MRKRRSIQALLVALLLLSSFAANGQFCQENPNVVCNADCRIVGGVPACYWDPQPWYACAYTSNGCLLTWDDCCSAFLAGF